MKKYFFAILLIASLSMAHCAEVVQPNTYVAPPADQSADLGTATRRWKKTYTASVSDGTVSITPSEMREAADNILDNDHRNLTEDSRAAPNQHPIAAITALESMLNQKAGLNTATQASNGLMSAQDKTILDNIGNIEGYVKYDPDGNIRLPEGSMLTGTNTGGTAVSVSGVDAGNNVRIGDISESTAIYSESRPTIVYPDPNNPGSTISDSVVVGGDISDVVRFDAEGDIALQAGTNIQVVIPQPNDPTTGDPVDPVERTLLDTDAAGNFIVGSPDSELNLQASVRPTTQVAGGAIEDNAFLSDLTDFATQSDLDAEIAYKADLVSGVVPDAQLPAHVKVNNWGPVAAEADLVTLTDATVNDRAFVGTENPYETYYLIAMPPTDSANWIQASGSGGDGTITSVNGDIGPVVNIDLPQFPGVQNALDDKANASDLATLAPLASPALTGTPTAPTPATTTNNTQVATAAFVNTRIASGNAATATTLQTARTIQTNLASTAAASFNGSANVAPGVTGVLPVANGGTGAATAANALTALDGTPTSRTISTTAPLTGGGNLTANRTLAISPATAATATAAGAAGSVTYAAFNDTTSANKAVSPAGLQSALNAANTGVPAGTILHYAGNSTPQGYLLCDGSNVSRLTYDNLFSAIGTLYGAGDGSTTFSVPNFTGSFLRGTGGNSAPMGTQQTDALQEHTHSVNNVIGSGSRRYITDSVSGTPSAVNSTTGSANARTAVETRPVNYAVTICIKY